MDAAEHEFGSLQAGDRVEHRFKVTNSGSSELQITNVKTNCGCTVPRTRPHGPVLPRGAEKGTSLIVWNENGAAASVRLAVPQADQNARRKMVVQRHETVAALQRCMLTTQ